ncbi:MAG: uncharacterized protein KVP18_003653 [Porospora cf. gigantea A]|uniref:uncharacterized protein n=1 Tax=Porospora cf. gigantea A TaxID=2853593 RepID=UPI00355A593C|nr:MAG: hypothetical protein KVP18_003653 [Porospora cf. gigantea A]
MGRLFKKRKTERTDVKKPQTVTEEMSREQALECRGPRKKTARFNDAVEVVEFHEGERALQKDAARSVGLEEHIVSRVPSEEPQSCCLADSIAELDEAIATCRSAAKLQSLLARKAELEATV